MNRTKLQKAASTFLASLICLAVSTSLGIVAQAQDQNVQIIDMTAKKYDFPPSPVHVKKGQKVQLKITSTDRDHGVKISATPDGAKSKSEPGLIFTSPEECWKIKKQETVMIEFVAQTPGTYTIKCCVECGMGHGRMKGKIIVDE